MILSKSKAGEPLRADDWNELVRRVNAFEETKNEEPRISVVRSDTQVLPVRNVGTSTIKIDSPCFATGSFANSTNFEEDVAKAADNQLIVDVRRLPFGNGTNNDLVFVAEQDIPAGKVGNAFAACGPTFYGRYRGPVTTGETASHKQYANYVSEDQFFGW